MKIINLFLLLILSGTVIALDNNTDELSFWRNHSNDSEIITTYNTAEALNYTNFTIVDSDWATYNLSHNISDYNISFTPVAAFYYNGTIYYVNYTRPNATDLAYYINRKQHEFNKTVLNVSGVIGGRKFNCYPVIITNETREFTCEWLEEPRNLSEGLSHYYNFEEGMWWNNTEAPCGFWCKIKKFFGVGRK